MLRSLGLFEKYSDIPHGFRHGFDMGITSSLTSTFTPPNHPSALAHPEAVSNYIIKERTAGRYTGPFSRSRLEALIGYFRSSPLGVVAKAGTIDEYRLVQDFSFPRFHEMMHSINSGINSDDFPCEWGTFSEIALIVMDAPPGTEAATLDVDAAFRLCPILPSQQPFFVVMWKMLFYIDHNAPFGASSAPGVFGRIADAMSAILIAHGLGPCKKWVDDFVFFRYRQSSLPTFTYDIPDIYAIGEHLGWPWKPSKTKPFAVRFKYLGFIWDLALKTVEIPDDKKARYLAKLIPWASVSAKFSRKEAESILGTLVHCSLAVPDGRSRLLY